MKIRYSNVTISAARAQLIERANRVLEEYTVQGFDLTLRQLYYQHVARGWIPNKDTEYKKLGELINDGRMAGLIDWDHIVDRTRNMRSNSHFENPEEILEACSEQFQLDKWDLQDEYVEVWVEKDALIGVLEHACKPLDVPYFSCRGYTSQSEMWSAAMRLVKKLKAGKRITVVHLGDHDPSGIDMSRDIEDRIVTFITRHIMLKPGQFTVNRIALNMNQVEEYNPPPNPAKLTDSRVARYLADYGDESWELDALEPAVLTALIEGAVVEHRDDDLWKDALKEERTHRAYLKACSDSWSDVCEHLGDIEVEDEEDAT
jgi:hypothetical protein